MARTKVECKIEVWWINSALSKPPELPHLYGDISGHPKYADGEFVALHMLRADFVNGVVETEDAFVKLGECQSLDRVIAAIEERDKKKGGDDPENK